MKLKSLSKKNKGFTLIELVVVLAIIAVMVAVTVPQFVGYVQKSQTQMDELTKRNNDLQDQLDGILENLPAVGVTPNP